MKKLLTNELDQMFIFWHENGFKTLLSVIITGAYLHSNENKSQKILPS